MVTSESKNCYYFICSILPFIKIFLKMIFSFCIVSLAERKFSKMFPKDVLLMISTDVSQVLLYRALQKQKSALSNLWLTRNGFCFKFVLLYIYISLKSMPLIFTSLCRQAVNSTLVVMRCNFFLNAKGLLHYFSHCIEYERKIFVFMLTIFCVKAKYCNVSVGSIQDKTIGTKNRKLPSVCLALYLKMGKLEGVDEQEGFWANYHCKLFDPHSPLFLFFLFFFFFFFFAIW